MTPGNQVLYHVFKATFLDAELFRMIRPDSLVRD